MTPDYKTCLTLKELGLPQIGDEWYCPKCESIMIIQLPERGGWACKCSAEFYLRKEIQDNAIAIPSTDQLLEWLEGKENIEYEIVCFKSEQLGVVVAYYEIHAYGRLSEDRLAQQKDHDLPTALAKLIIELEQSK